MLHFLDLAEQADVDSRLIHDVAGRVRAGNHGGTERLGFGEGIDGHTAGAGDHDALAVEGCSAGFQHLLRENHGAGAGGFGPHEGTAPGDALAGQDGAEAFEHLGHCLVELGFARIPCEYSVPNGFEPCVHETPLAPPHEGRAAYPAIFAGRRPGSQSNELQPKL
jgi:hypothetical protein